MNDRELFIVWLKANPDAREYADRARDRLLMEQAFIAGRKSGRDAGWEQDALRYRLLREQRWHSSTLCVTTDPKSTVRLGTDCPSLERLDAAIDAIAGSTVDAPLGEQSSASLAGPPQLPNHRYCTNSPLPEPAYTVNEVHAHARRVASYWRDDAFEQAALIVERYQTDPWMARDIRALKSKTEA